MNFDPTRVTLVLPALNEEKTIAETLQAFYDVAPNFHYIVVDNGSTDQTVEKILSFSTNCDISLDLLHMPLRGKANAIRLAFQKFDGDYLVMCDSDLTYPADRVNDLISALIENHADMIVGDRHSNGSYSKENSRKFHELGNNLVQGLINFLYKAKIKDAMSGYRVFTRSFIHSYPITVSGFELEVDLTIHALDKQLHTVEVPISYKDRPIGSTSKLNTFVDGAQVIKTVFRVFRYYKPFKFFTFLSFLMGVSAIFAGLPAILDYIHAGFVKHVPLAILAAALAIMMCLFFATGLILDSIADQNRRAFEYKRLSRSN
jgi:glycosyltransferase involved in cell wall biosynthesis